MNTLITTMALVLALTCSAAGAATINDRQENQRQSIRNGLEDGSLSGPEAKRLGKQQAKLESRERRMRSDGNFTRRERAALQSDLNDSRARIYRQRHDEQGGD